MYAKHNVRVVFDFGIIDGDSKRALEDYVDPEIFVQRKNYDEYTSSRDSDLVHLDLTDLQIISENFKVTVTSDGIHLDEKG